MQSDSSLSQGLPASSITAPALFRVIEAWSPTLLIDELDRVKDDEGLTALMNAGTRRDTAIVIRVEKTPDGEFEPRGFSNPFPGRVRNCECAFES